MRLKRLKRMGRITWLAAFAVVAFPSARPAFGYSVLAHEAIVDRAWEDSIKPLLLLRFPGATPDQLVEAHAYCYGGCIIQDLGYYPFSGRYFSDLTHYVRSGDFIESLIRNAADLDEYAFALGALCHYAGDILGHPIAVNKTVPLLYPRLGRKYGGEVTYEDNESAHIRTEFGFDVIQVASGMFAPNSYHHFIGFKVSKPLLERAFLETYGIELKSIFASLDLALGTYRRSVSSVIPEMTRVAWAMRQNHIQKQFPGLTRERFVYSVSRSNYEQEWGHQYRTPGLMARTPAFLLRIVPKAGPFNALAFRQPTPEAERLFVESLDVSLDCYKELLRQVADGRLRLENINLDTGRSTRLGDYRLADQAYTRLLKDLARNDFSNVSRELRENIISFYANSDPTVVRTPSAAWKKTNHELERLLNSEAQTGGRD